MTQYAKLNGQSLEYPPRVITKGDTYYNPYPVEMQIADGYKEVVETVYPDDGKNYAGSWSETDTQIVRVWTEVVPTEDDILDELRARREEECFAIVDRSKLWYDTLTSEQLEELRAWYNAWLEVTETKIIPEKPIWLNPKNEVEV